MSSPSHLTSIAPFFIVENLARTIAFYVDRLGFELRYATPEEAPFFAIVGRDAVQILLKEIGESTPPLPNSRRDESALWDAFVYAADPDALAEEFVGRDLELHRTVHDRSDGLRGFEVADVNGYVLFFGYGSGDIPVS